MPRYDPKRIESKWQACWDEHQTFKTPDEPDGRDKLYVLDMFPYPSGDGLHVGHPEGYTATDITSRYARMRGKNVLHPMGWDAFGLPAEQHAIKTGTHPRVTTDKNIDTFRRQLKMLGFSYDWSREFSTTDPEYFRWTQWIFLKIYNTWYDPHCEWTGPDGKQRTGRGRPIDELPIPPEVREAGEEEVRRYQNRFRLAYQHEAPVNWCPALGTVLSNEEVDAEGRSERGNHPVERLPLRQWMLRITAYADRLQDDLDEVDWSESIKLLQRNWIGKSHGAEVDFYIGPNTNPQLTGPNTNPQRKDSNTNPQRKDSNTNPQRKQGLQQGADAGVGTDQGADAPRSLGGFEQWKAVRAGGGFPNEPASDVLRVYTTRPDTLFGATYMVLAPEHPFVERLTTPEQKQAVDDYCRTASLKSDLDRTDLAKEKTGVFTGSYAVNPVNGEPVPIWIADYVLISYGTGAIMAVPAHDQRDFDFAKEFKIPIRCVVDPGPYSSHYYFGYVPPEAAKRKIESKDFKKYAAWRQKVIDGEQCFAPEGTAVNSRQYNDLTTAEFKEKIAADLAEQGLGRQAVNYKLRDWLFSRQHFWGEPFPIWHELDDEGNLTGLLRTDDDSELPVTLPENFDFKPHGRPDPPLEEAPDDWLYKTAADGTRLKRETNSMPQWAGSCWYYIRFCDPRNSEQFVAPEKERYWLPVDLYIGGAEHAVLHLLYARFWHKVLFDRGHLSRPEPFQRLVNQGMILGEAELTGYRRVESRESRVESGKVEGRGSRVESEKSAIRNPQSTMKWVSADDVKESVHAATGEPVQSVALQPEQVIKKGDKFVLKDDPSIVVESRAFKMSKSRGNVINPDDIVARYGADALRLYEMFMGPLEQVKPWNMSGVDGVYRFLGKVWRMIADDRADEVCLHPAVQDVTPTGEQLRVLHKTIKAVTDDIEKLSFNTAISRMMEFTNALGTQDVRPLPVMKPFVQLLAPFAPHLAEECWELLGGSLTLTYEPWPECDEKYLVEAEVEIPVQVNGKLRSRITVPAGADQAAIQSAAEADETIAAHVAGKQVVKTIVVPGRLVNFVVKG